MEVGTLVQSMVHGTMYSIHCCKSMVMETMYLGHCCTIHAHGVEYPLHPCAMGGGYPCTIHAPWEVVPLYNSMVHGTHVPYLLCTIHAPWRLSTLSNKSMPHGGLVPFYNPWCIGKPCTLSTVVQSMVHGDRVPYLLLYNPCPHGG